MSEYQYVEFVAIDAPVTEKNLEYMQRQSTRAEITNWSFINEYHYGSFRGNALEMLRRGYDFHLHFANYGTRKLLIRLPAGLPDPKIFEKYEIPDSLEFIKDPDGPGGSLSIIPFFDGGDLDYLSDVSTMLNRLIPLRAELLEGDLRPLYLAHLVISLDSNHDPEESHEAPVPAGLEALTDAQWALTDFFDMGASLINAAAIESPPLTKNAAREQASQQEEWIQRQPEAVKNVWLASLMKDRAAPVRAEMLTKFRTDQAVPAWPTSNPGRTMTQLCDLEAEIAEKAKQRAAATAAKARQKKLGQIAADPTVTLLETERLVATRSTSGYQKAAELLAELREAHALVGKAGVAEEQALKLKTQNPTLKVLHKELRKAGLVAK